MLKWIVVLEEHVEGECKADDEQEEDEKESRERMQNVREHDDEDAESRKFLDEEHQGEPAEKDAERADLPLHDAPKAYFSRARVQVHGEDDRQNKGQQLHGILQIDVVEPFGDHLEAFLDDLDGREHDDEPLKHVHGQNARLERLYFLRMIPFHLRAQIEARRFLHLLVRDAEPVGSKGQKDVRGQRANEEQVEEKVEVVDVASVQSPFVVEQRVHERMVEKVLAILLHHQRERMVQLQEFAIQGLIVHGGIQDAFGLEASVR